MFIYIVAYLIVLSGANIILYAADKARAKRGAFRVPEAVLLGLSVVGGATGGLIGMIVCRHKTRKWYFVFVNVTFALIQIALAVAVCLHLWIFA